jgi:hypothetical protein
MNTPTPITITEGHKKLWNKLYNLAHDQIFDDFEQSDDPAYQLIAEFEARATADLRDSLALEQNIGNAACDELRADADELRGDVVRLTTERDQLRAEAQRFQRLQRFIDTAAAEMRAGLITFGGIAELRAERDQLRADCENETKWAAHYLAQSIADKARAERAEAELATEREKAERYRLATLKLDAELATERARLDSGQIMLIVAGQRVWHCGVDLRAAIDAAIKEDAK